MSHSMWHEAMNVEDAIDGFELYEPEKPVLTLKRTERPVFRVGGRKPRNFLSEWQAYLFLARRVVGWIRDHYKDDQTNECLLCAKKPLLGPDEDGLMRGGCRYHADRSYNDLIQRIARALRRHDRRRAEAKQ